MAENTGVRVAVIYDSSTGTVVATARQTAAAAGKTLALYNTQQGGYAA